MIPTKKGQIVKFINPLDENEFGQLFVVIEIKEDGERSRVDIVPLHTDLPLPPITTIQINELEVVDKESI